MNIDADVGEGNVDGDPPKRSEYDQINEGEAITITKVLAGTDVKEKDNTVIVATESDTHIKIIGYNCGYYYDCDYWHEYDIREWGSIVRFDELAYVLVIPGTLTLFVFVVAVETDGFLAFGRPY